MISQKETSQELDYAHPGRRYQAQFVDMLVSLLVFVAGLYLLKVIGYEADTGVIVVVLLAFSYFVFSDALPNGQSIGKIVLKLSVISYKTGKPCSIVQAFLRNVFSPILGWIDVVLMLGKKRQRLGDLFAGTVVVDLR